MILHHTINFNVCCSCYHHVFAVSLTILRLPASVGLAQAHSNQDSNIAYQDYVFSTTHQDGPNKWTHRDNRDNLLHYCDTTFFIIAKL